MCQYLYAAFSLRTTAGPGLTATQLESVERWRRTLLEIAAEEMLHWSLVNNMLTAIGSAPYVSRPNLPHRAKGYPPEVQFALLGFSEAALRHFIYFERPQDVDVEDAALFTAEAERPPPMDDRELQPRPQDYVSQGELYRALDEGLEHLDSSLGSDLLFIGPPWAQAGLTSLSWPGADPRHGPRERQDRARPHHRAGRGRHESRHGQLALRPLRRDPRGARRTARAGPGVPTRRIRSARPSCAPSKGIRRPDPSSPTRPPPPCRTCSTSSTTCCSRCSAATSRSVTRPRASPPRW